MSSKQFAYSKMAYAIVGVTITCSVITLGYLQHNTWHMAKKFHGAQTVEMISKNVESNKYISAENSKKLNELHAKVVERTVNEFKSEDMQAWIIKFKRENPDLHIPDFILDSH